MQKNANVCSLFKRKRYKFILLKMKLIAILFLAGTMAVSATSYSQVTKIDLSFSDSTSPADILGSIEKTSGFIFIHDASIVNMNAKKIISANAEKIEVVLDKLFQGTNVAWLIDERQVFLYKKDDLKTLEMLVPKTSIGIQQPKTREVTGTVTDSKGQPVIGASVVVKGTTVGKNTDINGKFQISVPADAKTLVISFIGMTQQEVDITGKTNIPVLMADETIGLDEVVIIGYGVQKRESVVGAITNTTEKDLRKRGGVANLASALSGQLPGVTIQERTGEPGKEDPSIVIRGMSTWNSATPLVLVDGIERRMNDINVNEIQSISVLKDASATAVFGVRGANGVILVTTKRGELGETKLSVSFSNTMKAISKITGLMESFGARSYKNAAVEHELVTNEGSWSYYTPYETLLRFKLPQTEQYKWLYPNINWKDVIIKPFATDQNVNINLRGGTEFTKYFASIAYLHQGDLMKSGHNDKGYDPGFSFNRLNFRGNVDFQLTPTTTLSSDLSGYVAQKKDPNIYNNYWVFKALYNLPPDCFIDQYPDGYYGKNPYDLSAGHPLVQLNEGGILRTNNLFIGTSSRLEQKLDFITKGLSAGATLSFDNTFVSSGPNINDLGNQGQAIYKYINPSILTAKTHADSLAAVVYIPSATGAGLTQGYDLLMRPWTVLNESVTTGKTSRSLYYKISLNWARSFSKNDLTALLLFSRNRDATGATFPSFREDWVSRATYAYDGKYFAEVNGAYNGSEKFGPGYRFGFFPSLAAGWMLSKEPFMMKYEWISKLKLRGSIGKIGSDAGISRWGYISSWTTGGQAYYGNLNGVVSPLSALASPYTNFSEGTIANPEINWETAIKKDIGLELAIFKDKFTLEADYFTDNRENIFMPASRRNVPVYFGASAVPINLGKTVTRGYELDMMYKNKFGNGLGYYIRSYLTHSKDRVLVAEDPQLQLAYLKTIGFQIGQTKIHQIASTANTWNDVYAQTTLSTSSYKLPGDYEIIDFNGDGIINYFDNMAYGYPDSRPMNTYSTFLGLDYKGFNFMIQFYGITNITQEFYLMQPEAAFRTGVNVLYADYWTPENTDANWRAPRLLTGGYVSGGNFPKFDGSYLRLKTMEIGYQVPEDITNRLGLSSLRFYINGNNLIFWSKKPDDIEYGVFGDYNPNTYPTLRQINMGVDVIF